MLNTRIAGTGSYLPPDTITNQDLEKLVDTNDQWIRERTGIQERRRADKDQVTSDLALFAATEAIENADCDPKEIEHIIFATTTPDMSMPNCASILQNKLGVGPCGAFDLYAACSGFLYGVSIADLMLQTGVYKKILVVGAEILTRFTDYEDRGTCILFSDGAGAFVLEAQESDESKVYSHHLRSDGSLGELLTLAAGGSATPLSQGAPERTEGFIKMNGREIFKNAIRTMVFCSEQALEKAKLKAEDIDWLIPHQANTRIIDMVAKNFGFPQEKVLNMISHMGNTSSATVPYVFNQAVKNKQIKRGQNVLLTAFGGGITSGSLCLKY